LRNQQRGLRREDGQDFQRRLVKKLGHVVVAHVDDPDQVAGVEQGHAHHGCEAQFITESESLKSVS